MTIFGNLEVSFWFLLIGGGSLFIQHSLSEESTVRAQDSTELESAIDTWILTR